MQHFIGCDVHTRNQVVAWIEEETGEIKKRRLEHEGEEVKEFYAQFPRGTVVGIEATFPAYWFERLMGELGHELWVGDAARIRASEVRYQKTDRARRRAYFWICCAPGASRASGFPPWKSATCGSCWCIG